MAGVCPMCWKLRNLTLCRNSLSREKFKYPGKIFLAFPLSFGTAVSRRTKAMTDIQDIIFLKIKCYISESEF